MKNVFLNDEENAIFSTLDGCSQEEKIKILEDSLAVEDEPTNQRTLRSLLSKLKGDEVLNQGATLTGEHCKCPDTCQFLQKPDFHPFCKNHF